MARHRWTHAFVNYPCPHPCRRICRSRWWHRHAMQSWLDMSRDEGLKPQAVPKPYSTCAHQRRRVPQIASRVYTAKSSTATAGRATSIQLVQTSMNSTDTPSCAHTLTVAETFNASETCLVRTLATLNEGGWWTLCRRLSREFLVCSSVHPIRNRKRPG